MRLEREQKRIMNELLQEGWTWQEALIHSESRVQHSKKPYL